MWEVIIHDKDINLARVMVFARKQDAYKHIKLFKSAEIRRWTA